MGITKLEGRPLTAGITATCGTAFMLFGYDQGVFGGILEHPVFINDYRKPSAMIQGQIVSSYDLGCIIGALLTIFIGDVIGRRKTIALACAWVILGGIIQSSSYSLAQMIVGRIVAGFGVGMNSVAIPMWQSETCKPEHRGKLIAIQLSVVIGGIALSNWINLGFSYVLDSDVSWRFPLAFQAFIALAAMALVACMPESPRWLCTKDRHAEAQLQLIISSIAHEKELAGVGWRDVFSNGPQQNFRRIVLGAGTSLMQQMGGINVVVYYLPVVLTSSFGFDRRQALILSACDFMSLVFWGCLAMLVIDRWGRKRLMLLGAFFQSICFAVAAAGLGVGTKASEAVAVTAIFLYHVFFGLSFLSIPFGYPSEINNQRMRNVGSSIAMITNWVFVYVIVLITPIGIETIGWKFYVVFAVTNFSWIPFVWYFYVETAGLSLEEIDRLFEIQHREGGKLSWDEATRKAKEEISLTRMQNAEKFHSTPQVDHNELS